MRYLTFSFDDGFLDSTTKTAAIFENFSLRAEFNVVASFSFKDDHTTNNHAKFDFLNELQSRGHIIQPHGYNHTDKTKVAFNEATDLIDKCIDIFSENLDGFVAIKSIFCFPYNASNEEVEQYVSGKFRAFRTGYDKVINDIPSRKTKMIFGDSWPNVEEQIDRSIQELLKMENGWLVYNTHGIDGEGWEPISSEYLEKTLVRLQTYNDIKILPRIKVLEENENA